MVTPRRAGGGRRTLAVVLMLAGVFSIGLAAGQLTGPFRLPWQTASAGGPGEALGPSAPTRITIPTLAVDAPVVPVGLDRSGAIGAPPLHQADLAGWYRDGPAPGQYGAAIIVGHVDNRDGPAVFHEVGRLRPGDRVEVARQDRQRAVFDVTAVRTYPKHSLPPDEVYGDFDEPSLRLITCGGRWVGGETGYEDNVIVFARLAAG